ncbi:peptide-methionine (S)-S-oxide reductase [Mucilaginibacter limnophilus]|uniref:Peptide methionine sulfoxide reductase MsrA n=1 Tax=Mucilaginibacter limnophilus TaxID=1932778 RepID=A0A3S2UNW5_9SPHI|nr:peptide-methionine (S)-S-oxide reductase MsrA [Mucilaginibacter limnophilus]RVU03092.1 peptide-methionine (S)-S-oxide reductase [Mucilaginibacter limnophilus]
MKKISIKAQTILLALLIIFTAAKSQNKPVATEKATFGMGCFWCTEAVFQRLKGVSKVESGYSGGNVKNPSYEDVSSGTTGHAEVTQITFNPDVISYKELLEVFWKMHDPTTLNRQGADEGTQYRSVIFYHNPQQKALADHYKAELNKQNAFGKPVVTQIAPYKAFYKAEDYHQNYYNLNGSQPYCRAVIKPKVDKLEKIFKEKLKK